MSGGKFGPTKTPERRCKPITLWPEADRALWECALMPADILEDGGARAAHNTASNLKATKGYGRWLTYLEIHDRSALTLAAHARITPERVRGYVERLQDIGNSTATILARLQELGEVARVMNPDRPWSFIRQLASRVRAHHRPARSKHHLRPSDELVTLGFSLIERAAQASTLEAALLTRDGLLIALLALVPLRRRNLADLRIDETLIRQPSQWAIYFSEDDTKTHTVFETIVPALLTSTLDRYVAIHRPYLQTRTGRWRKPSGAALWVSKDGSAMTQIALYDRIRAHTLAAFGTALHPHLFRDAAATTLAIADPARVRVAAPVLGHKTFKTTERHYQHAKGIEAHRAYTNVLRKIRRVRDE